MMAYWIAHLRIAEIVLNKLKPDVEKDCYFVGSVAADSGVLAFDESGMKTGYAPSRHLSHWTDDIRDWDRPIHYERFYEMYCKNEIDYNKKSFYLGYYIHLLTDAIWMEIVMRPIKERFPDPLEYNKIAKKQVRDDFKYTERIFLKENPDFEPLNRLKKLKSFFNCYLDYFSQDAIGNKLLEIADAYDDISIDANREFTYFTYEQYEEAIYTAGNLIGMHLRSR